MLWQKNNLSKRFAKTYIRKMNFRINHLTKKNGLVLHTNRKHLEPVFKEDYCQIWTGDFNALSKEDYSEEQWNNITGIRKQNRWELPKTDLTKKATLFLSNRHLCTKISLRVPRTS